GLKAEKNVSEYLNKNYGSNDVGTFMQHQLEVFDNVENLGFYLGRMTTDLDPLFFIGDKPIYKFEGWSNGGHVFYRDGYGEIFYLGDDLDNALNEGKLYKLEGNKKVKVTKMPEICANNNIHFKE
ncbi:MAG: hypothetical protein E6843_10290, partial [Clostridium perfringens]|nr:hypothetical protein [Clostridium perfringens]